MQSEGPLTSFSNLGFKFGPCLEGVVCGRKQV